MGNNFVKFDNLWLFVKKIIIHNPNAPHKQGTPKLKDNYAHAVHGPTKCNQRGV